MSLANGPVGISSPLDAPLADRLASASLTLRLALRELRGGVRGFYVFIACLAVGVMAIAAVGSLTGSLTEGLAAQSRVILGGDVAFSLIARRASAAERAFLAEHGDVSVAAMMRAMARTGDGRAALVEVKAVDDAYPLYGSVSVEPAGDLSAALARRGDVFGAVVDPSLLERLDLRTGARVTIGGATFELRAALTSEPDKLAGGIGFGPRLMMSHEALAATGLVQPGSLVRFVYRVRMGDHVTTDAVDRTVEAARARFPEAGWEIRNRSNAAPQLERNIERFSQYLTLVGLTALLIGGVGVANSARYFLDRKRDVMAILKSMGATGSRIVAIYFVEVLVIASIGVVTGLVAGAALPFAVAALFGTVSPLPIAAAVYPGQLALAAVYGLLTAAMFSLWQLGRAHDVPVAALFRDHVAPLSLMPRRRYALAVAVIAALFVTLAVTAAFDRRIAIIFVVAAATVFALLRLIASLVMILASRVPRPRTTVLRLAVANIFRPGALTPTVVMSLGLGLALLVTILEIDANLSRQFSAVLPERAPSFFFIDIPSGEAERFDAAVRGAAPAAKLERVPMLRGRIVGARGVKAEDLKPKPEAAWALQSDRGMTYTAELPAGSRLVAGAWWAPDYSGPPLVSLESKIADGLGLKIGDDITVNVLGRNLTARIASLRAVDWNSLGINFVLVFSPTALRGAPHMEIATATYPDGGTVAEETALMKAVLDALPGVTVVRVKDALDAVGAVVRTLLMAVRAASSITLISAIMVLGGALAAGHRHRVYDAVILKTLGATRLQLMS
ncbi:MAG: ABC transporter permease, partial [Bradyrhizobiaceae bacterium]|nr:ABC transporter permease [Bradyrhizobiaceae bacterium]